MWDEAALRFVGMCAAAVGGTFGVIFVASVVAWRGNCAWQRRQLRKERKDVD